MPWAFSDREVCAVERRCILWVVRFEMSGRKALASVLWFRDGFGFSSLN